MQAFKNRFECPSENILGSETERPCGAFTTGQEAFEESPSCFASSIACHWPVDLKNNLAMLAEIQSYDMPLLQGIEAVRRVIGAGRHTIKTPRDLLNFNPANRDLEWDYHLALGYGEPRLL